MRHNSLPCRFTRFYAHPLKSATGSALGKQIPFLPTETKQTQASVGAVGAPRPHHLPVGLERGTALLTVGETLSVSYAPTQANKGCSIMVAARPCTNTGGTDAHQKVG